jgi:hypothetical protein
MRITYSVDEGDSFLMRPEEVGRGRVRIQYIIFSMLRYTLVHSSFSVGVVAFAGSAAYFVTNVNMYGPPKHLLKNN